MRLRETPVLIPNTMVKPQAADGTALVTVWESRWPPKLKKNEDDSQRRLQNTKFERTSLRILKCKPTNVLKDSTKSLCIDTDTGNWRKEGSLRSTPSAGKCCSDSWFYQWLESWTRRKEEVLKVFRFLMTDKFSQWNKEKMRSNIEHLYDLENRIQR